MHHQSSKAIQQLLLEPIVVSLFLCTGVHPGTSGTSLTFIPPHTARAFDRPVPPACCQCLLLSSVAAQFLLLCGCCRVTASRPPNVRCNNITTTTVSAGTPEGVSTHSPPLARGTELCVACYRLQVTKIAQTRAPAGSQQRLIMGWNQQKRPQASETSETRTALCAVGC